MAKPPRAQTDASQSSASQSSASEARAPEISPPGATLDCGLRAAIEALVVEHAWLIDHGKASLIAGLYTEDGRMTGLGPDLVGQEAIRDWAITREAMTHRMSRHICTNLRLAPRTPELIEGSVLLTVYRHDGPGTGEPTPFAIAEYEDLYQLGADRRWRFAARHLRTLFSRG